MGIVQSVGDLLQQSHDLIGIEGNLFSLPAIHFRTEVTAFDVLHHQEVPTLVRAEVVDLNDVGVPELGDGLSFAAKTLG
jgi:hypothetical protein